MGANGNRKQTLRTNIIQPYESGFLADTGHKDYNAVVGQELDKVSTATKHMFQGLDDLRTEVNERTKALDALHLTVNDQFNKVMMEISGVKMEIGQGITVDSITDADGNVLGGVLEGIKTQVNAANGSIMVALGEITNTNTKFDGQIIDVKTQITLGDTTQKNYTDSQIGAVNKAVAGHVQSINTELTDIRGTIDSTDPSNPGLRQIITKAETDLTQKINTDIGTVNNSLTNVNQLVTTINTDGTAKYKAQWDLKTSVNGLVGGAGFVNDGKETRFVIDASKFLVGQNNVTEGHAPFSVIGDTVYANNAIIQDGQITNAKISDLNAGKITTGLLKSTHWGEAGHAGWAFNADNGDFGITGVGGSRLEMNSQRIIFYDANQNARIIIGTWA